jgi:hypothetical protein
MSNYPPGVSGTEYEIAGPDAEYTAERTVKCWSDDCPLFEQEQDVEINLAAYRGEEWGEWACTACGKTRDYTGETYV